MTWERPIVLLGLWILPLVAGLLVYAHRKRKAAAGRLLAAGMVGRLVPELGGPRPWIKGTLLLAGLTSLIVAGARPRFGTYFDKVSQRGVDLFVLLDVSRSMLAQDVAPSRLERAKSDVRDLVGRLVGDRVGLIVFAGQPVIKTPLTIDQAFFRSVLDEVNVHSAPRGGTLIGDAIRKAITAMPPRHDRDQVLVLITDGDDQDSYPEEAAKQAAERGIKIFTVGLGDPQEGARIPNSEQKAGYLRYRDQEVWSKMDENLLKKIALTTGGACIPAGTRAYDLGQVYEDHLASLARSEFQVEKRKRYHERFQWFLGLGLFLLVIETAIRPYHRSTGSAAAERPEQEPLRSRAEDRLRGVSQRKRAKASQAAVGSLVIAAMLLPDFARAGQREASQKVAEGVAQFQSGEYKQAAETFLEADKALPADPRIQFDQAAALAAQGEYDKAIELYRKAALAPDRPLAIRCHYNLGCLAAQRARTRLGEHPEQADSDARKEGIEHLLAAVGHYRDVLKLDENHAGARHNLELIRLWIKHMEALWRERDQKKARQEAGLLEYLLGLQTKQRELRATTRLLAAEKNSPERRQEIVKAETAQRTLAEEIPPLKEKLQAELEKMAAGPQGSSGSPQGTSAPATPQVQKAITMLTGMADETGRLMRSAADHLKSRSLSEARTAQEDAVEKLDQIYLALAPFAGLVNRAVQTQQGLVDEVGEAVKEAPAEKKPNVTVEHPGVKSPATPPKPAQASPQLDGEDVAWNQDFITRWAEVLGAKAAMELKRMASVKDAAGPSPAAGKKKEPADKITSDAKSAGQESLAKQQEALRKSLDKAVSLTPDIQKLSGQAVKQLQDKKPSQALPKQEEALKLLKEIAELLPKDNQNDSKDQNDDKKKQDQKDQDKQNQDSKDSRDQKKQDKKKDQSPQDQKSQSKNRDPSKDQAEAMMRKVQQRLREHRNMKERFQPGYLGAEKVEKDW